MSKEEKNQMVPKLRFSKFRDNGPWEEKTLCDIGDFTGGGTPSKSNDEYWRGNIPWISSSDISDEFIDQIKISRFITEDALKNSATKLVPANTILLVSRVGVGKLAISKQPICTSQDFTNFTPHSDVLVFLAYYLKSKSTIISSFSQGMAIKGFTKDDISSLNLLFPSKDEQHKIADCLSSLDEYITAETQQLEALKSHKKGLLQQLFPAEGETAPQLRFAEFKDSGKWEEKTLASCLAKHPEYGINAAAVQYSANLPTYLRITDISEDGNFIRNQKVSVNYAVNVDNYLKDGDIVLARTGASVGKSYKYKVKDGKLVFAGFLIRVSPDKDKLNSELLFQYLSTEHYWRWIAFTSTRSGQPGVNGNEYALMPILLPKSLEEQQKIADCLSSLDELITAQAEKIEAVKIHKKGLMQGLFPDINKTFNEQVESPTDV